MNFWNNTSFAMPWISQQQKTDGDEDDKSGSSAEARHASARESIDSWFCSLNDFAKQSLDSWKASASFATMTTTEKSPTKNEDTTAANNNNNNNNSIWALHGGYPPNMPEGQLMQYGMGWTPDGKRNPVS